MPPRARRSRLEWATLATVLLLGLGAARSASAADTAHEAIPAALREACAELGTHATVQAKFEYRKVSALFAREVLRTGTLRLRRSDGRLIWAYDGGAHVLMADGRFYPVGKSKEELGPGASGFSLPGAERTGRILEALFQLDPVTLAEFFAAEPTETGAWKLRPTDKAASAIFTEVRLTLGGDPLALREVAMDEATGDRTVVTFTDIRLDEALPAADFQTPAERSASVRAER